MRTEGQTDTAKLIITSYDFVNASKNSQTEPSSVIGIPNIIWAA